MPFVYRYDPAEHREKHCGLQNKASFQRQGSAWIGQCPANLDKTTAQTLLDNGIGEWDDPSESHPARIFTYYQGAVYVAVPTEPGHSYHGFPWRGRPGHNRVARHVLKELIKMAENRGEAKALQKWLDEHNT